LPAFVSAGLSLINLGFAFRYLPESRLLSAQPPVRRFAIVDLGALRNIRRYPGVALVLLISFNSIFWFAGVQAVFRLFTLDAFRMNIANTGRVLGLTGLVAVIVQGGLIGRLTRRFGEVRLLATALALMSLGFALQGFSASVGVSLFVVAVAVGAVGTALHMPSVSSYVSRRVGPDAQGATLGVMQSASALARAIGPLVWGLLYDRLGLQIPCYVAAATIAVLAFTVPRLPRL
jgi:DHA1 family tetracycline resistance protein-like MFS transporter